MDKDSSPGHTAHTMHKSNSDFCFKKRQVVYSAYHTLQLLAAYGPFPRMGWKRRAPQLRSFLPQGVGDNLCSIVPA